MSRAGKKRRAPITLAGQPNMVARLAAAERATRMAETALVLSQPHRRGNGSQECATALGRFWLSLKTSDKTLMDAGEAYARIVRQYRRAWGIATESVPAEPGSDPRPPMLLAVQKMGAQIDRIEAELTRVSCNVRFAVTRLVIEDRDLSGCARGDAQIGLRVLARQLGLLKADHPFK